MKVSPVLYLIGIALFSGCARDVARTATEAPALPPAKVRLVTAQVEMVPAIVQVTGTVRPVQRAQIAAKVMGTIEDLPVSLGQAVNQGDVLLKISAAEITARVAQAQAQLNAARRDLERERELLTKGASTADMVRGLEDRFATMQALVREAEVMQGYTTITAPFAGVVARKLSHVGDLAAPGQPLLELEGTSGFEIEAGVPDSAAAGLKQGMAIPVSLPGAGVVLEGKLAEISSAADANARTIAVKITLPSHHAVRSGQFVRIELPGTPSEAIVLPVEALSRVGQMERVFVAGAEGRAVLRLVKSGAQRAGRVEILSGLDGGDRVVLADGSIIQEGQRLEVQP